MKVCAFTLSLLDLLQLINIRLTHSITTIQNLGRKEDTVGHEPVTVIEVKK